MSSLTKIKDDNMNRLRKAVKIKTLMRSAELLGLDHSYLSRVVNGKQRVSLETLVDIVERLELSLMASGHAE